jgi:putative protein-disulfide isomerase
MTDAVDVPDQILIYVHDPMCSWCYGFRPTWHALKTQLPNNLPVVSLLGGLADDSDTPMAEETAAYLQEVWTRIETVCGVPFDHSYWNQDPLPPRTTFIACRAVIAAERLAGRGEAFAERIQDAYYNEATNVWNIDALTQLAESFGFRKDAFRSALESAEVRAVHDEQRALAERLEVTGYPSLLLIREEQGYPIAIRHGDPDGMRSDIEDLLASPQA